jgi:hypothetical protein
MWVVLAVLSVGPATLHVANVTTIKIRSVQLRLFGRASRPSIHARRHMDKAVGADKDAKDLQLLTSFLEEQSDEEAQESGKAAEEPPLGAAHDDDENGAAKDALEANRRLQHVLAEKLNEVDEEIRRIESLLERDHDLEDEDEGHHAVLFPKIARSGRPYFSGSHGSRPDDNTDTLQSANAKKRKFKVGAWLKEERKELDKGVRDLLNIALSKDHRPTQSLRGKEREQALLRLQQARYVVALSLSTP